MLLFANKNGLISLNTLIVCLFTTLILILILNKSVNSLGIIQEYSKIIEQNKLVNEFNEQNFSSCDFYLEDDFYIDYYEYLDKEKMLNIEDNLVSNETSNCVNTINECLFNIYVIKNDKTIYRFVYEKVETIC